MCFGFTWWILNRFEMFHFFSLASFHLKFRRLKLHFTYVVFFLSFFFFCYIYRWMTCINSAHILMDRSYWSHVANNEPQSSVETWNGLQSLVNDKLSLLNDFFISRNIYPKKKPSTYSINKWGEEKKQHFQFSSQLNFCVMHSPKIEACQKWHSHHPSEMIWLMVTTLGPRSISNMAEQSGGKKATNRRIKTNKCSFDKSSHICWRVYALCHVDHAMSSVIPLIYVYESGVQAQRTRALNDASICKKKEHERNHFSQFVPLAHNLNN